jgi:hypothetical protein
LRVTIQRDVAAACIERCVELGYTRYNAMLGESHALVHQGWLGAPQPKSKLCGVNETAARNSSKLSMCM